jgi:peptide/nickel transport system substrate-binding protein
MSGWRWVSVVVVLWMLAGCGGTSGGGGGGGNGGGGAPGAADATKIKPGKRGGVATFLSAGDVDYVDPGQTYYTFGYMVHYAVNRTLYSFKPDDSIHPVPDLAVGPPRISRDNKTITVKIRRGVRYAPPVNREVKAQDVKYAFERAFSANVPSPYAATYFGSIVGAPSAPGEIRGIAGITTPDDFTIVFKLSEPQAPLVSQALVMPITTPVPREYAAQHDKSVPSTYDQHVAFTGPYMIRHDASGELTGRVPGKSIDIVRNPNWDKSTDYRPAYLDEIRIEEGNSDTSVAGRRVLAGESMLCCDSAQPPPAVLKRALSREKNQVLFVAGGITHYISLNTTVKPLDNLNIRKAIIAASDRDALRLTSGGKVIGPIANGFIPPGIAGFAQAGGLRQNTDLDFLKNPQGSAAVARKYMLAAKKDDPSLPIDADGRWTGDQKLLTVAANADPGKKQAEVFQNQAEKLGFKLNFRLVPQDTLYTKFMNVPKANVAFGPSVGWAKDFTDPQSMLDATFNGEHILQQGNVNWPELDVPAINRAMAAAATLPVGDRRSEAWAKINHMIAAQAPAIPLTWDQNANLQSSNVVGVVSAYITTHDLSFTSLK